VAPFYFTNRECDPANEADPTVRTLRRLAIPFASERLLCKEPENRTGDKGARRAKVAAHYRIVLLLGDDFGDFLSVPPEQDTVAGRAELARVHQRMFGDRWFVLPNPTYGSWERAVGFDVANKERALRVD
jgi:acid phosphatase